jgi:hypothetical protein
MLFKNASLKTLGMSLALALAILACDLSALPAPYDVYVTTTGNNSNDCRSVARACLTVAGAMGKAVTAGAIVIGAGTFSGAFVVNKFVTVRGAGQAQTILTRPVNNGPVVAIEQYITVTLSNMTIRGGYQDIELRGAHTQLYGNTLTITNAQVGIENSSGGQVELTNVRVAANAFGINNAGVFRASNLTLQGNTNTALYNTGIMEVDNLTVQQSGSTASDPQANVAILNVVRGSRVGRITIRRGTITNNHQSGIWNQGGTISISDASISNNRGGGITNTGTMTLNNVVVQANGQTGIDNNALPSASLQISRAAIIQNGQTGLRITAGTASVVNTTVSGNRSVGIAVSNATLDLAYSTVASNTGLGLYKDGSGTATVRNSIIALNSPLPNCQSYGTAIALVGPNFACDDTLTAARLRLGALGAAAGTFVMPLQSGSPAINAASGDCPPVDQRGYARPYGSACDVGAHEFGSSMAIMAGTPGRETPTEPSGIIEVFPSETPAASITPTPGASMLVLIQNANCRRGPGSVYPVLTSFLVGQSLQVDGRSEAAPLWWQVALPNSNQHCWVSSSAGTPPGDPNTLPVIPAPPTPIPTAKPGGAGGIDFDKDGYTSDVDCDDKKDKIHPGAAETPGDGVDSNCNGKDDS